MSIDLIIINLDKTLQLVQVRHLIDEFHSGVAKLNCTVALAAELQFNDKLFMIS